MLGAILGLIAFGLSIAFGMMEIVNFAHGEFFAIGLYTYVSLVILGFDVITALPIALLAAPIVSGSVGLALERTVLKKLYDRHEITTLLATWGFALMMRQSFRWIWGSETRAVDFPLKGSVDLFFVSYGAYRLVILLFGVVSLFIIYVGIHRSDLGLKARATIQNREVAEALGINTKMTTRNMFLIGTAVAALAGVIYAPIVAISPNIGFNFVAISFVIVILGGLGDLGGTLIASFIVGISQSFIGYYYSPIMSDLFIYAIVLVIILVLPKDGLGGWIKSWKA